MLELAEATKCLPWLLLSSRPNDCVAFATQSHVGVWPLLQRKRVRGVEVHDVAHGHAGVGSHVHEAWDWRAPVANAVVRGPPVVLCSKHMSSKQEWFVIHMCVSVCVCVWCGLPSVLTHSTMLLFTLLSSFYHCLTNDQWMSASSSQTGSCKRISLRVAPTRGFFWLKQS